MSGVDWNGILQLPQAALAGNARIPKATVIRQAQLNKNDSRVLNKVRRLEHFATVQKSTTRIPPLVDGEHNIQSVIFLRCEMAGSEGYSEIAGVLHKCFPNPTVILFDGSDEACVSVATTRRSRAEHGAFVIDTVGSTGRMHVGDQKLAPHLGTLAFGILPQEDLGAFLEGIVWNVRLVRVIPSLGFFPSCSLYLREKLSPLIERHGKVTSRIEALSRQRKTNRDLTLNESARLRVQESTLHEELDSIVKKMKEICSARD